MSAKSATTIRSLCSSLWRNDQLFGMAPARNTTNLNSHDSALQQNYMPQLVQRRTFSLSSRNFTIQEFFELKQNWGKEDVRSGRSWLLPELRQKSNIELWKLWYVLYKEKNMLLTMEQEAARCNEAFPNPERIDKVEESMKNLQTVIAERDRAYNLVEHGITGEPPVDVRYSGIGLRYMKRYQEYLLPYWQNTRFWMSRRSRDPFLMGPRSKDFFVKFQARSRMKVRDERRRDRRVMRNVQELYPNSPDLTSARRKLEHSIRTDDVYHSKMSD